MVNRLVGVRIITILQTCSLFFKAEIVQLGYNAKVLWIQKYSLHLRELVCKVGYLQL